MTVRDQAGETARACLEHTLAVISGVTGIKVVWDESEVNEPERYGIELALRYAHYEPLPELIKDVTARKASE